MKIGKLPEPMLIRSVLREVGHRREEILAGPAVGRDCAVKEPREGEVYVFSSDPITGTTKDMGKHSVYITANDLAAAGAEPVGIMLTILLPPKTEERELKEIMRGVESTCRELNMEIMGGHTEITDVVKQPLLSLTGVGTDDGARRHKAGTGHCDYQMDWIGRYLYCGQGKGKTAFGTVCAAVCGYGQRV